MTPDYAKQLGFWIWKTNINAQKIDSSSLEIYRIVIAIFQIMDKLGRAWFFQGIFLLTDTTIKLVLGMFFLIFNNINI